MYQYAEESVKINQLRIRYLNTFVCLCIHTSFNLRHLVSSVVARGAK